MMDELVECIVEYDYEAELNDELSLQVNMLHYLLKYQFLPSSFAIDR